MKQLIHKYSALCILIICCGFTTACGPTAFVKGSYDDIERVNLLNDQWSESDMQAAVKDLVNSASKSPATSTNPIVIISRLQNKTSESIDTQSVTDMVRVELMKSGKFFFIDKEARSDIKEEYSYQSNDKTEVEIKQKAQQKAEYMINGRLDSIVQEVGKNKTVYYKLTLNMTDIRTGLIVWSDHKQIRKIYKKRSI